MANTHAIALFQSWPGKRYKKYGIMDRLDSTETVSIFSANKQGLEEAIKSADNPQAILVHLNKMYFTSESLLEAVKLLISQKKGIKIFTPISKLPGGNDE